MDNVLICFAFIVVICLYLSFGCLVSCVSNKIIDHFIEQGKLKVCIKLLCLLLWPVSLVICMLFCVLAVVYCIVTDNESYGPFDFLDD